MVGTKAGLARTNTSHGPPALQPNTLQADNLWQCKRYMDPNHHLSRRLPSLPRTYFFPSLPNFFSPRFALFAKKNPSAAVRTCHLPAYPPPRVQLDAHPAIRSHRRLRRRVPRRRPCPRRSTAGPEHTSQAPPTSPDARRRTRTALHTLRAFASATTSSDR